MSLFALAGILAQCATYLKAQLIQDLATVIKKHQPVLPATGYYPDSMLSSMVPSSARNMSLVSRRYFKVHPLQTRRDIRIKCQNCALPHGPDAASPV